LASLRVAVSCAVPPTRIVFVAGVTVTVATGASWTVISVVAVLPSIVAVIVVVPGDTAVTVPSTTVATPLFEEVHVVVRPVSALPEPSFGVAVSVSVVATFIVAVDCDIVTEDTVAGLGVVEPSPPPQATTTTAAASAARCFDIRFLV
jgi:hypothetical protein